MPFFRIGVMAGDYQRARYLAHEELGLPKGDVVIMSPRNTVSARGCVFRALLVDESAWPLTEGQLTSLLPALDGGGHLYKIERIEDPWHFSKDSDSAESA